MQLQKINFLLLGKILSIICLFLFSTFAMAKTTVINSYRPRIPEWLIEIDKCVITAAPYFIELDVNRYLLQVECADYDDMKAFAEGKISDFYVYPFVWKHAMTRSEMKAFKVPNNLQKGNVWTLGFSVTYLGFVERRIYYASDRKSYRAHGELTNDYSGLSQNGSAGDIYRLEYLTTVKELISGTW